MKYLLLLLLLLTPAFAQEATEEKMPTEDLLTFLNISANGLIIHRLKFTLPAPKYGAIEFRRATAGEKKSLKIEPLGPPAKVFVVEFFFSYLFASSEPAPLDHIRPLTCKFSSEGATTGTGPTSITTVVGIDITTPWSFSYTAKATPIFTAKSGSTVETLSFISSDKPILKSGEK